MICDDDAANENPLCDTRITEHLDSRRMTRDSRKEEVWELHLFIQGTNDECAVKERIKPGTIYGLPATFPDVTFGELGTVTRGGNIPNYPLQNIEIQNIGWQLWEIRATYSYDGAIIRNPYVVTLPTNVSLSTRGGNTRISQSIKTWKKFPAEAQVAGDVVAPDLGGAIEWDGKTVKGISVPKPLSRYSESWVFDRWTIFNTASAFEQQDQAGGESSRPNQKTWNSLMALWEDYTATVHGPVRYAPDDDSSDEYKDAYDAEPEAQRGPFRNWDPGSVLLDNVGLRQIGLNHFEVTFDFLIQSNFEEPLAPSVDAYAATTGLVDGWDHFWYMYQKTSADADDSGGQPGFRVTAPEPRFGYVDRIIERRNFEYLQIGYGPLTPTTSNDFCQAGYDLMGHWADACRASR